MTRQEAIDQLEYYIRWKNDVHLKIPDMIKVESAIKTAVLLLKEDKKIIEFYETI